MTVSAIDAGDPVWHDIADTMPVSTCVVDGDGRLLWANRRWREDVDGDASGDLWSRYSTDELRDRAVAAWREGIAAGRPFDLPAPGPKADHVRGIAPDSGGAPRWLVTASADAPHRADQRRSVTRAELDTLTNAMPQMIWATQPDGHHDYYNAQWYRFTGMPEGSTDGEGWNGMFHPDDQDRAWARWRHSLTTGDAYEIEYRLRHHSGDYRWVLGRALPVRGADGAILRWIGTCTDIDSAKRAAEQNDILSRELSHRIKNIFAIVSGLVRMSARRAPAMRGFADDLAGRIAALGAAHDLARPHSEQSRPMVGDATLRHVLEQLLSPYDVRQWDIGGDDVPVDDRGATPIALIFHELATNAAKYGALSTPEGRVAMRITQQGDDLSIEWRESGGPPIAGPPAAIGFGTRLAALSIEQQLAGTINRDWLPEGLAVRITVKASALIRDR